MKIGPLLNDLFSVLQVKRSTDLGADYVVFDDKDHDDHDEDHDHEGPCDHKDHEKDHEEEEDHHDEEEEEISSENLEKLKLDENVLKGYQIPEQIIFSWHYINLFKWENNC